MDIYKFIVEKNLDMFQAILSVFSDLSEESSRIDSLKYIDPDRDFSENSYSLHKSGIFDSECILSFVSKLTWKKLGNGVGIDTKIINFLFDSFKKSGLITKVIQDHWQLSPLIKIWYNDGLLTCHIFGLPEVCRVMARAVPAINVRFSNGDQGCGSGVIFKSKISGMGVVISNRHVLDGVVIESVVSENCVLDVIGEVTFSDTADLAKFVIRLPDNFPNVHLADNIEVLDEVVAMGYPLVPTARNQYLMCHRGEINGIVETIQNQKLAVISCHVNPGNSGGPIFNKFGFLAGLVTQSGTSEFGESGMQGGTYKAIYHMATPVDVIKDFIS